VQLGAALLGRLLFVPTTKLMEQGGSPQQTEHLNPKAWPAAGADLRSSNCRAPNCSRPMGHAGAQPFAQGRTTRAAPETPNCRRNGGLVTGAAPWCRTTRSPPRVLLTKVPLAVVALARVPLALVLLAVVLLAAVALALVPGSRSQSLRKHPQRKDRPPASNRPGRSPRLSRPGAG